MIKSVLRNKIVKLLDFCFGCCCFVASVVFVCFGFDFVFAAKAVTDEL